MKKTSLSHNFKKVTVQASPDIAFVKYWGNKDATLRLPENGSISMVLDGLYTTTTLEFIPDLQANEITIEGKKDAGEVARADKHLNVIRQELDIPYFGKIVSENSFPSSTGLSSSSSAFAALALAATKAAGHDLDTRSLSILARLGSGSACRCVAGGLVEWHDGTSSDTSYAESIFPAEHWNLRNVIVVVDEGKKRVSTTEGHRSAQTSPFYQTRLQNIPAKIQAVKSAYAAKDFATLGNLIESEALEFHSILLTSQPSLIAWYPGTVEVMLEVQKMRSEGIEAYFTINTGFNVHVITLPEYENQVAARLENLSLAKKIILAKIGKGPREIEQHLF